MLSFHSVIFLKKITPERTDKSIPISTEYFTLLVFSIPQFNAFHEVGKVYIARYTSTL